MRVSESQLALLTKRDRKTVRAKLLELPFVKGAKSAKLYEAHIALNILYCGGETTSDPKAITPQEAARRLTIKRTEEIALNMEVTREERIPLDDIEESEDKAITNCAGILKAHEGKALSPELIQELFGEFREMGALLRRYGRKLRKSEDKE